MRVEKIFVITVAESDMTAGMVLNLTEDQARKVHGELDEYFNQAEHYKPVEELAVVEEN